MFRRFSYFIFDKWKQYYERFEAYLKKHPNQRKLFDFVMDNNPLSGYDLITCIVVGVVVAVMAWGVKWLFY